MNKDRIFVGSSSESLDFANAVQEILHHYYHVLFGLKASLNLEILT